MPLDTDLNVSDMRVPSRDSIDRAWIRLDNCATLFNRMGSSVRSYRSLMADSSQKLWNYFCVRETRTEMPQQCHAGTFPEACGHSSAGTSPETESAWNVSQLKSTSFAWQLTVLGYGAGNILYKCSTAWYSDAATRRHFWSIGSLSLAGRQTKEQNTN